MCFAEKKESGKWRWNDGWSSGKWQSFWWLKGVIHEESGSRNYALFTLTDWLPRRFPVNENEAVGLHLHRETKMLSSKLQRIFRGHERFFRWNFDEAWITAIQNLYFIFWGKKSTTFSIEIFMPSSKTSWMATQNSLTLWWNFDDCIFVAMCKWALRSDCKGCLQS